MCPFQRVEGIPFLNRFPFRPIFFLGGRLSVSGGFPNHALTFLPQSPRRHTVMGALGFIVEQRIGSARILHARSIPSCLQIWTWKFETWGNCKIVCFSFVPRILGTILCRYSQSMSVQGNECIASFHMSVESVVFV